MHVYEFTLTKDELLELFAEHCEWLEQRLAVLHVLQEHTTFHASQLYKAGLWLHGRNSEEYRKTISCLVRKGAVDRVSCTNKYVQRPEFIALLAQIGDQDVDTEF